MPKKTLILFTVLIDIIGIGIVIPVLPFYVKSFGVSDFVVTSLFAVFALFSFFSAPLLGSLSDRYGRRPILLISILSTSVGWFVFAGAPNVLFLFLGRIIDGLAAGNISTAQSYLADIAVDEKDRAGNMGLIGAMFGIGFIIGPLIGGLLGTIAHALPFYAVGTLALLNVILAYFFLPETHLIRSNHPISVNPLLPIVRAFRHPVVLPLISAWFLIGVAVSLQQSVFTLFVHRVFGLEEFASGIIFTLMGVILVINQGYLLKKFWLHIFSQKKLLNMMLIVLSIGFFLTSIPLMIIFAIGLLINTFAQSTLRTVMMSLISGIDHTKRGENMGTMTAFMSLSMIVGPFMGGWLFTVNAYYPFITAGVCGVIAYMFVHASGLYAKLT